MPANVSKRSAAADAYSQLIREVFRINGDFITAGNKLGRDLSLTTARWQILGPIKREPLSVPHIARGLGLARQNVQRIVDLLVEEGLVELAPNPHHRRAKLVKLTAEGRKRIERIGERQNRWANRISMNLSAKSILDACNLLGEVRRRLKQDKAI